ncbi:TPA: autotransporter domain-containing protein [Pluralibacter gergoviae]
MIIKRCSGLPGLICPFFALAGAACPTAAFAWQQEYIVTEPQSDSAARYTWDSDHPPRYNDVLAERINASLALPGVAFTPPESLPTDATRTLSMQLNIPIGANFTTGPVASWRYDGTSQSIWNEFGDSASTAAQNDPLWHASVSTLGWRINSQPLWGVHPWAQISFNQQFGENQWKSQSGLSRTPTSTQDGSWRDVTLGADMLLNPNFSAYASFSQADNLTESTNYIYMMGMSARF